MQIFQPKLNLVAFHQEQIFCTGGTTPGELKSEKSIDGMDWLRKLHVRYCIAGFHLPIDQTKEMVAAEADDPYLHHSSFHLACHQSWGLPHQQLVVLIYWQLFSKAAEKPILQQNTMARQFHAHQ
jgi:hypothetical protein